MPDERCETCRYWRRLKGYQPNYSPRVTDILGECLRYPPTITDSADCPEWPATELDRWCGEYRPSGKPVRSQTSDDKTPATSINWTTRETNILTDICGNLLGLSLSGATLQDLSAITVRDLRETRNCGEATTSQIVYKLKFAGVELKEDYAT